MSTENSGGGTWLERAVSPPLLFVCGMAAIPAFLLQERLGVRAGQVAAFYVLAFVTGSSRGLRTLRIILILLASTVLFHVLSPVGRVLAEWGPLVLTEEALHAGLVKGLSLVGLMLLSRLSVRRGVVLPGTFGLYVSTSLAYLNGLLEKPPRVTKNGLISRLDRLFEAALGRDETPEPRRWTAPSPAGVAAACGFVAANWGLVFFLR